MKTKVIKIKDTTRPEDGELLEAAEILRSGGLVAFPTETVYGLGANALDEAAAKKAVEQGITVLSTELPIFEAALQVYGLLG